MAINSPIIMFSPFPDRSYSTSGGNVYATTSFGLIYNVQAADVQSLEIQGCVIVSPRNNPGATTDPTGTDDFTKGYGKGSWWTNVSGSPLKLWFCTAMGTTAGSATWVENTLGTGDVTGPISSTKYRLARYADVGGGTLDNRGMDYVTIEDFGGGTSFPITIDNTPALNAAVAYCVAQGIATIYFPTAGVYGFNSDPDPIPGNIILAKPFRNYGSPILVRNYTPAEPGFIWFQDGLDNGMSGLALVSAASTSGGIMLYLQATHSGVGFFFGEICETTYLGVATDFEYGMQVDGHLNNTPGAQGFRDTNFSNTYLFGGNTAGLVLNGATNAEITNFWVQQKTFVDGGAGANEESVDCTFAGCVMIDRFEVDHAQIVSFNGICNDLTITANASYVGCSGVATGTIFNAGTHVNTSAMAN